jgi:hypothetical protein
MVSPNWLRIVPNRPFNPSAVCSCVGPAGADALGPVAGALGPAADEDLGPGADEDFCGDIGFVEGPLAEWACVGAVDVKIFAEFNTMATPIPTIPKTRIAIPAATIIKPRRPPPDPGLGWGCQ